jgi:hypothetical protein
MRIATDLAGSTVAELDVKQCAVLFVNAARQPSAHPAFLRDAGFVVHEIREWPDDDRTVPDYQVVVVLVRDAAGAPMLAARLRAKRHFDRALLIALVKADATPFERRAAQAGGFDDVVNDCCEGRQLAARILRGLRGRRELRCMLPRPLPRRSAA